MEVHYFIHILVGDNTDKGSGNNIDKGRDVDNSVLKKLISKSDQ